MDTLRQIAVDFWGVFAEMSPYLLFGFFVAGLLSMLVSRRLVERHLGGGRDVALCSRRRSLEFHCLFVRAA